MKAKIELLIRDYKEEMDATESHSARLVYDKVISDLMGVLCSYYLQRAEARK